MDATSKQVHDHEHLIGRESVSADRILVNLVFDWLYTIICMYIIIISEETPIEAQVSVIKPHIFIRIQFMTFILFYEK